MENLPTQQRLLLIYGKTHITLEQAVADWMPHINIERAKRRAKTQTLPWPVISSEDSQKSGLFVSLAAIEHGRNTYPPCSFIINNFLVY